MGLDANGVYRYEGGDEAAPAPDLLDRVGASLSPLIAGPWQAYSPVPSGFAMGTLPSGTPFLTAIWREERDLIHVLGEGRFGSNGVAPTQPRFTLPVAAAGGTFPFEVIGHASLHGPTVWAACITLVDPSQVQINYDTGGQLLDVSPTAPFTWLSGHGFAFDFTYRPAA